MNLRFMRVLHNIFFIELLYSVTCGNDRKKIKNLFVCLKNSGGLAFILKPVMFYKNYFASIYKNDKMAEKKRRKFSKNYLTYF